MQQIKSKKSSKSLLSIIVVAIIMTLSLNACATSKKPSSTPLTIDTDGDGIPNIVEKTYGTNPYTADTDGDGINDKLDKAPLNASNPIVEPSAIRLPITIKDARVEDNSTKDHMELTLINDGSTSLSNFEIYYSITDKLNSTQENYYQVLKGTILKPGETKTIHFDNQISELGHYFMNMNGLYGTSSNGLIFQVQLHVKGFSPMNFTIEKSKGTAEVSD